MSRIAAVMLAISAWLVTLPAMAAAGWTDYGPIVTIEQNSAANGSVSNQVMVVVSVTTNPASCGSSVGFYFTPTDDRQKRLFAMLMAAQLAGRNVRIYTTGTCHAVVGYAELDGVVVQ